LASQEQAIAIDKPIVVDATDHIAGRLSSNVAKLLLKGNRVSIVNCDKIMISGTRSNIISEYRDFLEINSINHWKHGPKHPRRPDTIMKRMIRGMLPKEKTSEVKSLKKIKFEKAMIKKSASNYTTMAELGRTIGWTE
jgi:large subunit ribosomal protein L13